VQGNEDGKAADIRDVPGNVRMNLHAAWHADKGWEMAVRVTNLFDRRYASYGALAADMFPQGRLASGQDAPQASRFIAPGAPRAMAVTLRAVF
jgi:outer membrane receptor protein involved in Fe transport